MRIRNRLRITGTVQGVGFRPFIYQLALKHGISGWVSNTSEGVIIEAEGEEDAYSLFASQIPRDAPRLASIAGVETHRIDTDGVDGFVIRESLSSDARVAMIPADVALCDACAADISDPSNRRYGYPFTNCTDCGPRFTIIDEIPYDRPKTAMAAFEMCPDCEREYHDPTNRRFHAQPNACPVCGPKVWLEDNEGHRLSESDAVAAAGKMLSAGAILAIKGLGGFHIACDASNTDAVQTLRGRKGRGRKPLAVMVRDLDEAHRLCDISVDEEKLLTSYERPIVLLRARHDSDILQSVAPGNLFIGLMLPYTPLHYVLFQGSPAALVMTSGNISEEPIAHKNEDAVERLSGIVDGFLMHDRDIRVACDDSVVRPITDGHFPIRRARGFVPQPIQLNDDLPCILACGAEQKATFALTVGNWIVPSQHIGDMDRVETLDYYKAAIEHFKHLFDVQPDVIAHDLHPDYLSTRYAMSADGPRKIGVQHHHAHIAACMTENRVSGPVIGLAFDGTGYGEDGCIWGGEALVSTMESYGRAARLRYVALPGAAAAVKNPGRMSLSHLIDAIGKDDAVSFAEEFMGMGRAESSVIATQIERGLNSPVTSSMGRLFDAVSAMIGLCLDSSYEGEPAVMLEMVAIGGAYDRYEFAIDDSDGLSVLDTRPIIHGIVRDVRAGVSKEVISSRFHNTVVEMMAVVCGDIRSRLDIAEVALSGGCFQNRLLLESATARLRAEGFKVYTHTVLPPNDGCISVGQAAVAAAIERRAE